MYNNRRMQHHGAKSSSSLSLFHAMKGTSRIDKEDIISASLLSPSTSTTALSSATTNQHSKTNNSNSSSNNQNSWLDRTTARLLDMPTTTTTKKYFDQKLFNEDEDEHDDEFGTASTSTSSSDITPNTQQQNQNQNQQNNQSLSPDDVNLITTLMASHARRSTIESAIICEQLLKRVVDEVDMNARNNFDDDNGGGIRVTTKMYTVGKDFLIVV